MAFSTSCIAVHSSSVGAAAESVALVSVVGTGVLLGARPDAVSVSVMVILRPPLRRYQGNAMVGADGEGSESCALTLGKVATEVQAKLWLSPDFVLPLPVVLSINPRRSDSREYVNAN